MEVFWLMMSLLPLSTSLQSATTPTTAATTAATTATTETTTTTTTAAMSATTATTATSDCNCLGCKNITCGPYKGFYQLMPEPEEGYCPDHACLYQDENGRELCMCDPGNVMYDYCDAGTTLNPKHDESVLKLIVHDGHDNHPISRTTAEVTSAGVSNINTGNKAGEIEVPIQSLGSYQVCVEAADYIASDFSITFTDFVNVSKLVILFPLINEGEVKIILTWGGDTYDLDIHVMDIPKDGSPLCRTYYANKIWCQDMTLDQDNTGTGMDGPEIVSLTNSTVNKHSVYAIAVMHYAAGFVGSGNNQFLTSEATVTVTDGTSTQMETLSDPGYSVKYPKNWWFVGCVEVDSDGFSTLTIPPNTTFFDGDDYGFTFLATKYCNTTHSLPSKMETKDLDLPPKPEQ